MKKIIAFVDEYMQEVSPKQWKPFKHVIHYTNGTSITFKNSERAKRYIATAHVRKIALTEYADIYAREWEK